MHQWEYDKTQAPRRIVNKLGEVSFDKPEPVQNLITWVYETGSFVPSAKIVGNETFSIINDYIGRPIQAYDNNGNLVWQTDYDIYGNLRNLKGERDFVPFRQLGQYEDIEAGLYYNRFRYYDPNTGTYISKDPISILGGLNVYAYVKDTNRFVDVFGLELVDPLNIFYSQNSISSKFKNKTLLNDVIQNIKENPSIIKDYEAINVIKLEDLPDNIKQNLIEQGAISKDIFTLDNRRLYVAKESNSKLINANFVKPEEVKINLEQRFSTKNAGRSIIVRCGS